MKLSILKENFKKGLSVIEKATGKSLSLPILNNILLITEKNYLNLVSTDLEIGLSFWTLAKIYKEGKTVVPGHFLTQLINFFPGETLQLEIEENFLVLESDNSKAKVKIFNPDDFPILPKIKNGDFIQINNLPFIEGLSQVANFTAFGSARPEISGVFLVFEKALAKMVATDSFRLAEKKIFFEKEIDKEYSLILPQKAVRELINLLAEKKGKLNIYFSPNQALFEVFMEEVPHPQLQFISRLIEGDFPDYQAILPKKYETQLILNRGDFLNQIRAAGLFGGKVNEVKFKIDPKKNGLEVFGQSPELGESQSFLAGEIKGKTLEIAFNWRFLAEGLSQIKSQKVIFELTDEEGPALLKPIDDPNFLYVAMPIKSS